MEILKAHPDEYDDLVSLYARYNFALTKREYFDWKFFQNPVGEALIYKMVDKGQLVGAVAIIPQRFRYQDREIIGLQTVDGLMGKEIRGKGLFNDVMAFLRQQRPDWLEGQEYFYLSFPSLASSVQAHAHAGWTNVGHFCLRTFVLRPGAVKRKLKPKFVAALSVPLLRTTRWIASRNVNKTFRYRQLDTMETQIPSPKKLCGDRSSDIIKWRILDHPRGNLAIFEVEDCCDQLYGHITVKQNGRNWEIVEVRMREDDAFLPAFLDWISTNDVADSVDLWEIRNYRFRSGFWPGIKRKFNGALFVDSSHAPSLPSNPDDWSISYLDSDW